MTQAYHILLAAFIIVPIAYFLFKMIKSRKELRETPMNISWGTIFNSSILYALAFNLIFFWQELFLALGKSWIGLTAYLYHNNHNWEGSHELAPLMQGMGAMAIFILGLVMIGFDLKVKSQHTWGRQLIFWLGFQGIVQSLPQIQTATLAKDTDVGQAMTYLGISEQMGFLIAVISTVLMVVSFRYFSNRLVWDIQYRATPVYRFKILLRSILLPAIIGTILIAPFRIFPWEQIRYPVMLLVIFMPWVLAFGWINPMKNVRELQPLGNKIGWPPIVLLFILLLFFQTILSNGVQF